MLRRELAGDEIPLTVVAADGSMILKYDKFRSAAAGCSLLWTGWVHVHVLYKTWAHAMRCRLAIKVAIAQITGKEIAQRIEIKPTEDG